MGSLSPQHKQNIQNYWMFAASISVIWSEQAMTFFVKSW